MHVKCVVLCVIHVSVHALNYLECSYTSLMASDARKLCPCCFREKAENKTANIFMLCVSSDDFLFLSSVSVFTLKFELIKKYLGSYIRFYQ